VHVNFFSCNTSASECKISLNYAISFVVQFHAEVEVDDELADSSSLADNAYDKFMLSRPEKMEIEAVKMVIKLCLQYKYVTEWCLLTPL